MEIISNEDHPPQQYEHSYFRSTIVLVLALFMVCGWVWRVFCMPAFLVCILKYP